MIFNNNKKNMKLSYVMNKKPNPIGLKRNYRLVEILINLHKLSSTRILSSPTPQKVTKNFGVGWE